MKIQFKKIGLTQEIINRIGEILTVSLTVEEENINPKPNTVMIDYDNMTTENKKIVDDFINLLKNS